MTDDNGVPVTGDSLTRKLTRKRRRCNCSSVTHAAARCLVLAGINGRRQLVWEVAPPMDSLMIASIIKEFMPRRPRHSNWPATYDTDTACTRWNHVYHVYSSNHGSYNHRLEKSMRLADILPGGGGWRKNRLSRVSRFFYRRWRLAGKKRRRWRLTAAT